MKKFRKNHATLASGNVAVVLAVQPPNNEKTTRQALANGQVVDQYAIICEYSTKNFTRDNMELLAKHAPLVSGYATVGVSLESSATTGQPQGATCDNE